MSQQLPTDPTGAITTLLGAGTVGAIALKLVERIFARADKGDDVAAGLRGEMVRRIESLERNYIDLEKRERVTFEKAVKLESENIQLRRRYHQFRGYMQEWVGFLDVQAEKLGVPQSERPRLPHWINEDVDGPTQGRVDPPPGVGSV